MRLLTLVLALGLSLTACATDTTAPNDTANGLASINETDRQADPAAPAPSTADDGTVLDGTVLDGTVLVGTLPDPEPGLVRVDGSPSPLAIRANAGYVEDSGNRVDEVSTGESRAFQRLCVGEVDVVDSTRPISAAEWEGCRAQGLDIVQFQVAADALVLAIKNETDVGGDCLDTDQVAAIFGASSTVTTWSQVGADFDDVALRRGGPDIDSDLLRSFGRYILDSPEPSLSSFAASYRTFPDSRGTRDFVVGSPSDQQQAPYLSIVEPRREHLRLALLRALRVLDDARAEVRAEVSAAVEGQDDDVRLAYASRSAAFSEVLRLRAAYGPVDARYQRLKQSAARVEAAVGTLGIFPQSFYVLDEDLLRPFEIEVADDDGQQNCIFPSAQTIVNGQYPLSRRLLLTATTRSLKRPEVADYLRSYLQGSRSYADAEQVIGLPAQDLSSQLAWIDDGTYPVFASIDGAAVEAQEVPVVGYDIPAPPPVEVPAQ